MLTTSSGDPWNASLAAVNGMLLFNIVFIRTIRSNGFCEFYAFYPREQNWLNIFFTLNTLSILITRTKRSSFPALPMTNVSWIITISRCPCLEWKYLMKYLPWSLPVENLHSKELWPGDQQCSEHFWEISISSESKWNGQHILNISRDCLGTLTIQCYYFQ